MKEFLAEHWLLVFALFMYSMGFLIGYLNGKRVGGTNRMRKGWKNPEIMNFCPVCGMKMRRDDDY